MGIKEIKKHNGVDFLYDIKKASECMCFAEKTSTYLTVSKKAVKIEAETKKIHYRLTRDIYIVKRLVMVIT